eukprot:11787030-Karenia_brevis.AAC.1
MKSYPANAAEDLFAPETPPEEHPSDRPAPATSPVQCPGCRGNVEKHHPMHNRVPGACRVANIETILARL